MAQFEPYYDAEANGVLFQVEIDGRAAQGYVGCDLLRTLAGTAAAEIDWLALYRRHRAVIDHVVARRAPAEGWETVMLRRHDIGR